MPYLVLGEMEGKPLITKTTDGLTVEQKLYLYSDQKGKKELFELVEDISGLVDTQPIEAQGYYIIEQKLKSVKATQTEEDFFLCEIVLAVQLGENQD